MKTRRSPATLSTHVVLVPSPPNGRFDFDFVIDPLRDTHILDQAHIFEGVVVSLEREAAIAIAHETDPFNSPASINVPALEEQQYSRTYWAFVYQYSMKKLRSYYKMLANRGVSVFCCKCKDLVTRFDNARKDLFMCLDMHEIREKSKETRYGYCRRSPNYEPESASWYKEREWVFREFRRTAEELHYPQPPAGWQCDRQYSREQRSVFVVDPPASEAPLPSMLDESPPTDDNRAAEETLPLAPTSGVLHGCDALYHDYHRRIVSPELIDLTTPDSDIEESFRHRRIIG